MRLLAELRGHLVAILRTLFIGPEHWVPYGQDGDCRAGDSCDGDELLDEPAIGQIMLGMPFI